MKNQNQCDGKLLYNSFSLVFMQTFSSEKLVDGSMFNPNFVKLLKDDFIDRQIFISNVDAFDRYDIKGFDIILSIVNEKVKPITLKGRVVVKGVKFFGNTMLISYRIIVNKIKDEDQETFCEIDSQYIDSDQMISLCGMFQSLEHWSYDPQTNLQTIDGIINNIEILNFPIDKNGLYEDGVCYNFQSANFDEVKNRYRKYFDCSNNSKAQMMSHTLIDLWEDIDHSQSESLDIDFKLMGEDDIIEHIETKHKAELVGIMSAYPLEWPYRMEASFDEICGRNIAIDTDDLVLSNPNFTMVFGTYGRRGEESETDWKAHLARRNYYHVCWPEFLTLLEMSLACRQIINYVWDRYSMNYSNNLNSIEKSLQSIIKQNAKMGMRMTHMLMELDAVRYLRYVSHKHMVNRLYCTLEIDEQRDKLNQAIKNLDISLNNSNSIVEIEQSNETKNILWFISIASLFGVLMQSEDVPLITHLFDDQQVGVSVAIVLNLLTSMGIIVGLLYLLKMIVSKIKNRKR